MTCHYLIVCIRPRMSYLSSQQQPENQVPGPRSVNRSHLSRSEAPQQCHPNAWKGFPWAATAATSLVARLAVGLGLDSLVLEIRGTWWNMVEHGGTWWNMVEHHQKISLWRSLVDSTYPLYLIWRCSRVVILCLVCLILSPLPPCAPSFFRRAAKRILCTWQVVSLVLPHAW